MFGLLQKTDFWKLEPLLDIFNIEWMDFDNLFLKRSEFYKESKYFVMEGLKKVGIFQMGGVLFTHWWHPPQVGTITFGGRYP